MISSFNGGRFALFPSNNPTKIHIVGSVASGKTTLAKLLSARLKLPYYELDNVVWERSESGDRRRSDNERDEHFNRILDSDGWIIEGVHRQCFLEGFQKADLIIFLDTDYYKRIVRIVKRFILQKLRLEKANYKPTLGMFKMMFVWNVRFERESKPEIFNILRQYQEKVLILNDNNKLV